MLLTAFFILGAHACLIMEAALVSIEGAGETWTYRHRPVHPTVEVSESHFPYVGFQGFGFEAEGIPFRIVNVGLRQTAQDLPLVDEAHATIKGGPALRLQAKGQRALAFRKLKEFSEPTNARVREVYEQRKDYLRAEDMTNLWVSDAFATNNDHFVLIRDPGVPLETLTGEEFQDLVHASIQITRRSHLDYSVPTALQEGYQRFFNAMDRMSFEHRILNRAQNKRVQQGLEELLQGRVGEATRLARFQPTPRSALARLKHRAYASVLEPGGEGPLETLFFSTDELTRKLFEGEGYEDLGVIATGQKLMPEFLQYHRMDSPEFHGVLSELDAQGARVDPHSIARSTASLPELETYPWEFSLSLDHYRSGMGSFSFEPEGSLPRPLVIRHARTQFPFEANQGHVVSFGGSQHRFVDVGPATLKVDHPQLTEHVRRRLPLRSDFQVRVEGRALEARKQLLAWGRVVERVHPNHDSHLLESFHNLNPDRQTIALLSGAQPIPSGLRGFRKRLVGSVEVVRERGKDYRHPGNHDLYYEGKFGEQLARLYHERTLNDLSPEDLARIEQVTKGKEVAALLNLHARSGQRGLRQALLREAIRVVQLDTDDPAEVVLISVGQADQRWVRDQGFKRLVTLKPGRGHETQAETLYYKEL